MEKNSDSCCGVCGMTFKIYFISSSEGKPICSDCYVKSGLPLARNINDPKPSLDELKKCIAERESQEKENVIINKSVKADSNLQTIHINIQITLDK